MGSAFQAALAEAMARRGVTQQALADDIGVTQSAVSKWLTGAADPPARRVLEAERALGVTPGSSAKHLGFGPPVDQPAACSVLDAIDADEELAASHRALLRQMYLTLTGKD